jgi:hypothetical protein
MSIRSTTLALSMSVGAVAVTLLAAGPTAAGAQPSSFSHRAGAAVRPAQHAGKRTCFNNLADESQVGIVSQDFGPGENAFDSQGADDFTLRRKCRVSTVGIDGLVFNGVATSFNVTFYKNKGGVPGKVVSTATTDQVGLCPARLGCDTAIRLPEPVTLKKGVGWVSVQANLELGEEFVWMTALTQTGAPAVWENPGDGWGTGCTTWATLQTCWGALDPGPDFEFVLLK